MIDIKTDNIDEWLSALPQRDRLRIKTVLVYLANERDWRGIPYVRKLTDCGNVYEIRITCNNIVYRPLGCFGPGKNQFTFIIGATKKGKVWVPKDAKTTAKNKCKIIQGKEN